MIPGAVDTTNLGIVNIVQKGGLTNDRRLIKINHDYFNFGCALS